MNILIELLLIVAIWVKYMLCVNVEVNLATKEYVNLVSDKFLSFTIDPKYLFATNNGHTSKECLCMVSSLSPSYIRIAGPSTSLMDFHDKAIKLNIDAMDPFIQKHLEKVAKINNKKGVAKKSKNLGLFEEGAAKPDPTMVNFGDWTKFASWAENMNFTIVFALNDDEVMESGMWDPNTALNILSIAQKAGVGEMVWQLGYECHNQTLEEYMNDLETLRLMVKASNPGGKGIWKTSPGDVSKCLGGDSRTTFKDYVKYVDDKLDYIFLNGNSSANELECIRSEDRESILNLFSTSPTPLWITESTMNDSLDELERAIDWMNSLGFSARNGFTTHFREIREDEMFEPTLSFYMSLLYKNLVGNRVLDLTFGETDMSVADKVSMFAHCTSLKKSPVEGAVTLFGTNMDDATTKYSIKMHKKENGGDVMQFILNLDKQGNILINSRPMVYRGDIRPVFKRVRPYKTLILSLPPRSFGFWVIANTNIEACRNEEEKELDLLDATPMTDFVVEGDRVNRRHKRDLDVDGERSSRMKATLLDLENLSKDIRKFNTIFASVGKFLEDNDAYFKEKGFKRLKRAKRQAPLKEFIDKLIHNKHLDYFQAKDVLKKQFQLPNPKTIFVAKSQPPQILQKPFHVIKTKPISFINTAKTETSGLVDQFQRDSKQIVNNIGTKTKLMFGKLQKEVTTAFTTQSPLKKYFTRNADLKSMIDGALANLKAGNLHKLSRREISNNDESNNNIETNDKSKDEKDLHEAPKGRYKRATRTFYDSDEDNEEESSENDINDISMLYNEVTKKPFPRLKKLINNFGNKLTNIDFPSHVIRTVEKSPIIKKVNKVVKHNNDEEDAIVDKVTIESKITDEDASLSFKENSNENGMLRIALENFTGLMSGLRGRGLKLWRLLPLLH